MVHRAAAQGFQRGAASYQRGRPTYHPEIEAMVAARCASGVVVELGAGTGIFTAALAGSRAEVIALEPVAAMRELLATRVSGVQIVGAAAESIPLASRTIDAVVAAQSFHWFRPAEAIEEIVRVLRPDGQLLTVWNVRDETVEWVASCGEVVERHAGTTPRYASLAWRKAIEAETRFVSDGEWCVDNPFPTDAEGAVERFVSTSFIAALDGPTRQHVIDELTEILAGLGPRFDFPYRCELQAWRRAGPLSELAR